MSKKKTAEKIKEDTPGKELSTPYEPTSEEKAIVEAQKAKMNARPQIGIKAIEKNGMTVLAPDHSSPYIGSMLLLEAIGATDENFIMLVSQLGNATKKGKKADEDALDFALSVVRGVEPKDQLEAMLAAQMAAVHLATMTFAGRLNNVETIEQQDSAEKAFNKLARTFALQLEALKKYRSTGEQKVTVQHVQVNDGGQAIVGNVNHSGG